MNIKINIDGVTGNNIDLIEDEEAHGLKAALGNTYIISECTLKLSRSLRDRYDKVVGFRSVLVSLGFESDIIENITNIVQSNIDADEQQRISETFVNNRSNSIISITLPAGTIIAENFCKIEEKEVVTVKESKKNHGVPWFWCFACQKIQ